MADFELPADQATISADHAAVVTPDDNTDLSVTPRALLIGTGGDLAVITRGGQSLTIPNAPAGVLPVRVKRVLSTGTTATDITAIW